MSCALANPVADVCANRRPVRGRAALPEQPQQAQLVPMAAGHAAAAVATPQVAAPTATRVPFAANAPEATFSIAQVREAAGPVPVPAPRATLQADGFEQPVRVVPPSFRDIRAGRAAAAQRAPIAEVVIPVAEVEAQPRLTFDTVPAGMEQMVERVRRRTAARLSRTSSPSLV